MVEFVEVLVESMSAVDALVECPWCESKSIHNRGHLEHIFPRLPGCRSESWRDLRGNTERGSDGGDDEAFQS